MEELPNEILLEIFSYLRTNYLARAFIGLNRRFDFLLHSHFAVFGFDLQLMNYNDYVEILQKHLTTLIDKASYLHFSGDKYCLTTFNAFYTHGFKISRFTQLKSLVLSGFSIVTMFGQIIFELPHLTSLAHLTLKSCRFSRLTEDGHSNVVPLVDSIWSLPKLTHFFIDETHNDGPDYGICIETTVISTSITHLYFRGAKSYYLKLASIFEHTPNIQHFSLCVDHLFDEIPINSPISSLISLEWSIHCGEHDILNMLRFMPNLNRLKITFDGNINGQEWEDLISKHLPKLEHFRFKMNYYFDEYETDKESVDLVLNTFKTSFWLVQRQWFVGYSWHSRDISATFFTLPYAFDSIDISDSHIRGYTCSPEISQQQFAAVRHLTYYSNSVQSSQPANLQLCKLESLCIRGSLNDYFWSLVPTVDRLVSCTIESYDKNAAHKDYLELLFSRAPRLLALKVATSQRNNSLDDVLLETRSRSFKKILRLGYNASYDEEKCTKLSKSLLAKQCEELSIRLKNRMLICYLMKTMYNLKVLRVQCDDDKRRMCFDIDSEDEEQIAGQDDELLIWLKQHLEGLQPCMQLSRHYNSVIVRLC